ncbi:MAG: SDR family NAD(P)-dependent oxidoreductase, partial [Paracoccaceae bacterium]|nr:SDR family NAD(P)-dependent oxidoreductase [Paracoccaceae bacterium]
ELPGIAVSAVGLLGKQEEAERDAEAARQILRSNFEGPALVLAEIANRFEARGSGTIVGISSVAGDRGRATNYVYGSAKAGFTAFLSGLRNRLAKKGVHVLTVLPGFVATKMTEGHDLPPKLTATPQEIAEAVARALDRRRNVIYVKPVWALVMLIIRNIPEPIFKRTRI